MQAILNADGRLELFAMGSDQTLVHVWQKWPNGDWSAWESLGKPHPTLAPSGPDWLGGLASVPAVGSNFDGRLEVFVTAYIDPNRPPLAVRPGCDLCHIWQTQ